MQDFTSVNELADTLVEAVRQEPYISKEILTPKIRTILRAFRLDLSTANYNSLETKSITAKRLRTISLMDFERSFWRDKVFRLAPEKIDAFTKEVIELWEKHGLDNIEQLKEEIK